MIYEVGEHLNIGVSLMAVGFEEELCKVGTEAQSRYKYGIGANAPMELSKHWQTCMLKIGA